MLLSAARLQILELAAKLAKGQTAIQSMKQLIVNADDFGLTEDINHGIIAAHRDGLLTSTSLVANGLAFKHAATISRTFGQLSVGVHFNLSQGSPVSPANRIPSLVNKQSELYLSPLHLFVAILRKQVNVQDIHTECRAQILKVLEAGIAPTHLDGHLHVHLLPQLSPVVIQLAREFGIRHVRCPTEDLEITLPLIWRINGNGLAALKRSAVAYGVSSFAGRFRAHLRASEFTCPTSFLGLAHTGFLDANALSVLLALVPNGTTELMCHPGYASAELVSFGGSLTRERELELIALTAPEVKERVRSLGIRLVNFKDWQDNKMTATI
jgi:chitin disaccharide deacetylase